MSGPVAKDAHAADCVVVASICFGWFIVVSVQSMAAGFPSHPFSDASLIELVASEFAFAALAAAYLHLRGYRLTLLLPSPSGVGMLVGIALYLLCVLAWWILYAALRPASATLQPIEKMVAGATLSLGAILALSIVNGFYEEFFLLGFMQRALHSSGSVFAVSTCLLIRLAYHLYQGPWGALSVLAFGAVLGAYYAWRRDLWPPIVAHMFADFAGLAL